MPRLQCDRQPTVACPTGMRSLASIALVSCCLGASNALAQDLKPSDQVPKPSAESAVYVEPITLTNVADRVGVGLNIGVVTANKDFARGLQKAADVYGLNLDLFEASGGLRQTLAEALVNDSTVFLIVDQLEDEDWVRIQNKAKERRIPIDVLNLENLSPEAAYEQGVHTLRRVRASLLPSIPKYDQILPIAFPVSPLPDNFFQPSKFPYPSPLVRVPRTSESLSASAHAHTSCNMVAQTGNMLHRTSSTDPELLLMGMEGGNLSLKALPGAIDNKKISAVMTSWVVSIRGPRSSNRQILVENNATESSHFVPGIHAPEELDRLLEQWQQEERIGGFRRLGPQEILIEQWDGRDRLLRCGMFLVAIEAPKHGPKLIPGTDYRGLKTLDFYSTQAFVQQLVEIPAEVPDHKKSHQPSGGLLTAAGTTVGNTVGACLTDLLRKVQQVNHDITPYILSLEGGFIVVTPEAPLTKAQMLAPITRVYLDLRGPLTSDQTILVDIESGEELVFRRTIIHFDQLDRALEQLSSMAFVRNWQYDGSRGRGINANVLLEQFLGKHRKFMSSLCTWPTDERPVTPTVRFYVDGMQRLNFTFVTTDGWRQEFVEVPLHIPPVPRDVHLYSGVSEIN